MHSQGRCIALSELVRNARYYEQQGHDRESAVRLAVEDGLNTQARQ